MVGAWAVRFDAGGWLGLVLCRVRIVSKHRVEIGVQNIRYPRYLSSGLGSFRFVR